MVDKAPGNESVDRAQIASTPSRPCARLHNALIRAIVIQFQFLIPTSFPHNRCLLINCPGTLLRRACTSTCSAPTAPDSSYPKTRRAATGGRPASDKISDTLTALYFVLFSTLT